MLGNSALAINLLNYLLKSLTISDNNLLALFCYCFRTLHCFSNRTKIKFFYMHWLSFTLMEPAPFLVT